MSPTATLTRSLALVAIVGTGSAWSAPAQSRPAQAEPSDPRPRLAIAGFEADPQGDPRDAWLAVWLEESLAWRLRRVPGLCTVPPIRIHQGRREVQAPGAAPPPWPDLLRGLGQTHWVSGRCRGEATAMTLELTLTPLYGAGSPARVELPAGRFGEVLDAATRWVLAGLDVAALDDETMRRVFAPPAQTVTAVGYYAQAVTAVRNERARDALRLAGEAVAADGRYRPALGLLAQLELQGAAAEREAGARRLRRVAELARAEHDLLDRAAAELALSLLDQARGASEAAHTRAQTALELATRQHDLYGRIGALSWLSDLYLTWQPPAGTANDGAAQQREKREYLQRSAEVEAELVALLESIGDVIGALPATSKLALLHDRLGQAEAALAMHERTLALARRLGSRRHEATAWLYLGQWYRVHERGPEALDALQRCLELAEPQARPAVLLALGGVHQMQKAPERALPLLLSAYEQVRASGELATQVLCLREIARVRRELGQNEEATAALRGAIDVAHALASPDEAALRRELEGWEAERGSNEKRRP